MVAVLESEASCGRRKSILDFSKLKRKLPCDVSPFLRSPSSLIPQVSVRCSIYPTDYVQLRPVGVGKGK